MILNVFLPNMYYEKENKEKYKVNNHNKKREKSFQEILNDEIEKYKTKENNNENKQK